MKKIKKGLVVVGGGFSCLHVGHIRHFRDAKALGKRLIVVLNNDNWLMKKKGYVFMPQKERAEILRSIRYVDDIVITRHKKDDADKSICRELRELMPEIYANGGDRNAENVPEKDLCEELGIKAVFGVGGKKIRSSSELIENVARQFSNNTIK